MESVIVIAMVFSANDVMFSFGEMHHGIDKRFKDGGCFFETTSFDVTSGMYFFLIINKRHIFYYGR